MVETNKNVKDESKYYALEELTNSVVFSSISPTCDDPLHTYGPVRYEEDYEDDYDDQQ